MAVVYLTFDSEVNLDSSNEETKNFNGKLAPSNWTITDFSLGKNELKIYHNEFLKGSHFVEGDSKQKYVIKGMVKMTVKPKVAELLLAGKTEWTVLKVKVTHKDESENSTDLQYVPSPVGATVSVHATLDKPAK
jgi:hypothetical protein